MLKIKRQDCLKKYPNFPSTNNSEEKYFYPELFGSYVLTIKSETRKGYISLLSKEIIKMMKGLCINKLIILGDSNTPWLYQKNDYILVQNAKQYLIDNGVGKKFNGALEFDIIDLQYFFPHLFWLQRGNAALPDFYFMDEGQNILGHICQYGNFHLSALDKSVDKLISEKLNKSKFQLVEGTCRNHF